MDDLTEILQQHLSGAPLDETLAQLTKEDPQMAQLAQILTLRDQQSDVAGDDTESDDLDDRLRVEAEATRTERARAVRQLFEELTADVRRLQETVDLVASALGGCPTCLGRDAACLLCRGRGMPGSLPPNPEAFQQVVMPAVRALAYVRSQAYRVRETVEPSPERS